jgi:hypothetical protein
MYHRHYYEDRDMTKYGNKLWVTQTTFQMQLQVACNRNQSSGGGGTKLSSAIIEKCTRRNPNRVLPSAVSNIR